MAETRRVKICYVIGTLDIGGTEKHLVEVVRRLDRTRYDVQVCALSTGGPLQEEIEAMGVPVTVIGFRGLRLRYYPVAFAVAFKYLWKMTAFFRRNRFDIVHSYLFWAYVLSTPPAKLAGVPVVVQSRRSLGDFKEHKPSYLLVERFTNRFADLFLPNSEGVRRDVMRQEHIPEERLRVIYNGVDPDRYLVQVDEAAKRRELGLPLSAPIAIVVANLIHYKGHRYLLEALEEVVKNHLDLRVLLVGEGPMRSEIERNASERGLGENILFLGQRTDVPELLALSDISILPSLEEGFSNTLLESMAAAKAIVATSVGGNPEAIEDGVSGLLVPPADSHSLSEAIQRLLNGKELRGRLSEAARNRAVEVFSMEAMIDAMESTYVELLERKAGHTVEFLPARLE